MKLSHWRRNSSAIIGGWLRIVETIETRTPLRCNASTNGRKSPSPEKMTTWSTWGANSMASTVSSMSMFPFTFRRPMLSVYSLAGFVTIEKPL